MSQKSAARTAWALFALTVTLGVGSWLLRLEPVGARVPDLLAFERNEQLGPISSFVFAFVGALIVSRHRSHTIGWLCLAIGVLNNVQFLSEAYTVDALFARPSIHLPGGTLAWWVRGWAWLPPFILMVAWIPLLFPDGRLPSRRWRWPAAFAGAITAVGLFPLTQEPNPSAPALTSWIPIPTPLNAVLVGLGVVAIVTLLVQIVAVVVAVVMRYRSAGLEQRQQFKWFTAAAVAYLVVVFSGTIIGLLINRPDTFRLPVFDVLWPVGQTVVPTAIGFAILRYRLYDIDVVINKTLVYGALAAFITLVYVAIVVGAGQLLGTGGRPNLVLSIIATALVAVAFQPLRERLQRLANRLVYGNRATPYEALADFSRRLSGAVSTDDVLPKVAEAAGTALNVDWAAAGLRLADGGLRTAEWGVHRGSYTQTVEVRHEDELLGQITLVAVEPFADERTMRVLNNFANQAGAVFRNLRLTAELQSKVDAISALTQQLDASRQRIVAAAEEERRRLESEISRTTRRQLDEITAQLREAKQLLANDPEAAASMLDHLGNQTNETLNGLRELARGVFPPLLIDKGVVPALQAHVRKAGGVQLEVDPRVESERFDAPVEAALYFSCIEALRGNSQASVSVQGDGDWVGCRVNPLGPQASTLDIRDRVEALGGVVDLDGGKYLDVKLPTRAEHEEAVAK